MAKKNPVKNVYKPAKPVVGLKFNAVKKGPNTAPGATNLAAHAKGGLTGGTQPPATPPYGGGGQPPYKKAC